MQSTTKTAKKSKKLLQYTHLWIITLKMYGFNSPIKRHRLGEWTKTISSSCYRQRLGCRHHFKLKGWRECSKQMGPKEAAVAIHISDKIQLLTKATQEEKEGTSFLIKATISQDNITILNTHGATLGHPISQKSIVLKLKVG